MKYFSLSIFTLAAFSLFAQKDTIPIRSDIETVTVYFQGANIGRKAKLKLPSGKHTLILEGITGQMDANRMEVKPGAGLTVLSVNHRLRKTESEKFKAEIKKLEMQIENLENRGKSLINQSQVFEVEEHLLMENINFQSKESGATVSEIRQAADFYRARINEIRSEKLKISNQITAVKDSILNINQQWSKILAENDKMKSDILVVVDAGSGYSGNLDFNYFVESAGWKPQYDFRVSEITDPLRVIYNANIYHSSGEDWKNVDITLMSGIPEMSGTAPELETWYINRPVVRPVKINTNLQGEIKGRVKDKETGEPLPYVNIMLLQNGEIKYGTTADYNGFYAIKPVKAGYYDVLATFVGYKNNEISGVHVSEEKIRFLDIELTQGAVLSEIEVVSDTQPFTNKRASRSKVLKEEAFVDNEKVQQTSAPEVQLTPSQISYHIPIPYTILANGTDYFIPIKEQNILANYKYRTLPKFDSDVYLIAHIPNWSELELLSGKSSIYYQGTYTGDAFVNADFTGDTLEISLGRDRNISVKREGNKEINDKRLIGSNTIENVGWNITVRNNKTAPIEIEILDQFPLSEVKSIVVTNGSHSGADIDKDTGKIKWSRKIPSGTTDNVSFDYQIKYPTGARISR